VPTDVDPVREAASDELGDEREQPERHDREKAVVSPRFPHGESVTV
jgi:hypothetical protein